MGRYPGPSEGKIPFSISRASVTSSHTQFQTCPGGFAARCAERLSLSSYLPMLYGAAPPSSWAAVPPNGFHLRNVKAASNGQVVDPFTGSAFLFSVISFQIFTASQLIGQNLT